jgi:hypothetical protein
LFGTECITGENFAAVLRDTSASETPWVSLQAGQGRWIFGTESALSSQPASWEACRSWTGGPAVGSPQSAPEEILEQVDLSKTILTSGVIEERSPWSNYLHRIL